MKAIHKASLPLSIAFYLFLSIACHAQDEDESKVTIKLDNYRGKIQWEQSTNKVDWASFDTGDKPAVETFPSQTTYYRAKITEEGCAPIFSDTKAVYVDGEIRIGAKLVKGKLFLPSESNIQLSDLKVLTLLDEAASDAVGEFETLVPDTSSMNLLLVMNKKEEVVMLGYFMEQQQSYDVNSETTALALLMMYPWQRALPAEERRALADKFKGDSDFKLLSAMVEKRIKDQQDIFDEKDTELTEAVVKIIAKGYNDGRLSFLRPIEITDGESGIVTVTNTSSVSYVGGVYDRKGLPVYAFTLAGSLAKDSDYRGLILDDNTSDTYKIDFNKKVPDEYEIRLRDGFAETSDDENDMAFNINIADLSISVIDVLIPGYLDFYERSKLEKGCLRSFVEQIATATKSSIEILGGPPKNIIEVFAPNFSSLTSTLIDCTKLKYREQFNIVFKYVKKFNTVNEALPTLKFATEWAIQPGAIDACKYVDSDKRVVSCFELVEIDGIADRKYVCDTDEIKVRLIENEKYYPYTDNPIPDYGLIWQLEPDNGEIVGSIIPRAHTTRTNSNGETAVSWKLDKLPGNQKLKVSYKNFDADLTELANLEFETDAIVPRLKVVKKEKTDNQIAEAETYLANPIQLFIEDTHDNLPVKLGRFDIKVEIFGGGKLHEEADPTEGVFSFTRKWLLGKSGEQKIRLTITNKDCDPWEIEGNPVEFKAEIKASCLDVIGELPEKWWEDLESPLKLHFNELLGNGEVSTKPSNLQITKLFCETTTLKVQGLGLTDLSIIKYFKNLEVLWCYDNQLTSLDISSLTNLTNLACLRNKIKSLDVSQLKNLQNLSCQANQLSSLDVSHLTNLKFLDCGYNQISTLDVSRLTNLESLWCESNQLSSLQVSSLTNLKQLSCSINKISFLNISHLTNLEVLWCAGNQLTSLDVSQLKNLQNLSCQANQISSLDVSHLTNLKFLDCGYNQISTLDVSPLTSLENLSCNNNQLTSLKVSNSNKLVFLYCSSNQLSYGVLKKLMEALDKGCKLHWSCDKASSKNGPDINNPVMGSDCQKLQAFYTEKFF